MAWSTVSSVCICSMKRSESDSLWPVIDGMYGLGPLRQPELLVIGGPPERQD